MTPKQILDSFSETLMRDERILSARERALLAAILQHAKVATGENHETQEAVRTVIAAAVGETVAQRAFAVLGGSIVDRILDGSSLALDEYPESTTEVLVGPQAPGGKPIAPPSSPSGPQSPGGTPRKPLRDAPAPAPSPGPQSPGGKPIAPPSSPSGPQSPGGTPRKPLRDAPSSPGSPSGPQSPGGHTTTKVFAQTGVEVAERPQRLPGQCVVLDEFLAAEELADLTRFTIEHEADFRTSELVSPSGEGGVVNDEHRRSRVLMDLAQHQEVILERVKSVLPQVLEKLGMKEFTIADVEAQVTASNDGDFFHFHSDNADEPVASRYLTFVYFFHREPRQFAGGELRIHDARLEEETYVSEGSYQTIVPQQNQIVFFPCQLLHEITPVKCASRAFADSRFTLNGWLRR